MSINRAIIMGRVGNDAEIRHANNGDAIATFSIATSERWKDKATGEQKEATEWHRVVVFNPALATVAQNHVKKGGLVSVEGAIKTRKWTDQSGIERYTTEIVVGRFDGRIGLEGKPSGAGSRDEHGYGTTQTRASSPSANQTAPRDLDDEVPF